MGDMLIQSTLTKSTKLSRYIESPLDSAVLVEDNLHALDGTCEWDPMRKGSLAIYEKDGGLVIHAFLFRSIDLFCLDLASPCCLAR